ncbi:hypothetical protein BV96_01362 [Sphingomonas paucimobilis]|nr:hypothetical protein BV96_01362 [Sphingomonas paucimobilis]
MFSRRDWMPPFSAPPRLRVNYFRAEAQRAQRDLRGCAAFEGEEGFCVLCAFARIILSHSGFSRLRNKMPAKVWLFCWLMVTWAATNPPGLRQGL